VKVISAEFVTSAAAGGNAEGIPRDGLPQIAMTGRSNVGKSTLLNALCRSTVARTSAAPGKTRLANIYRVTVEGGGPGRWSLYLVDLPGYGYARGGADAAEELRGVAEAYFASASGDHSPAFAARRFSGAADERHAPPGDVGGSDAAVTASAKAAASLAAAREASESERRRNRRAANVAAFLLVDSRHPGLKADTQAANWLSAMGVDYHVVATKVDKLSRSERARNMKALELTLGRPPLPVSAASGEGLDALWKTIASLARTAHA
jgi:GTP-binding protein EngB required for normal cell division